MGWDTPRRRRRDRPGVTHAVVLCFQCVEELSTLLQSQALLLPALKLLLEGQDPRLHAAALGQVAAVTQVTAGLRRSDERGRRPSRE